MNFKHTPRIFKDGGKGEKKPSRKERKYQKHSDAFNSALQNIENLRASGASASEIGIAQGNLGRLQNRLGADGLNRLREEQRTQAIARDAANTAAREAVQAARGSFGSYQSPQVNVAMPTRTAQIAPVPQITPQTNLANHFKTRGEAFNYARKQGWKTFTYDDGKGKYKQFTTEVAVPASGTTKQQGQQGQQSAGQQTQVQPADIVDNNTYGGGDLDDLVVTAPFIKPPLWKVINNPRFQQLLRDWPNATDISFDGRRYNVNDINNYINDMENYQRQRSVYAGEGLPGYKQGGTITKHQQGGVIEEHNQRGVQSIWPAVGNFINNNKNNISQALKTAGALAYPMVGGYFAGRKLNDKLRNRTVTQYTGLETNDGPPLPQARDPFYVVPFHNRNEIYDRRDVYTPHPEKGLEWKNDKLTENIFAGATREEKDSIYNAEKIRFENEQREWNAKINARFANEQRNRAVRRQQGGAIEDLRINDELKLEALFRYFQAKGVPQENLIDPETGSFNSDYEEEATKFFQTVGEDTAFWSAYKSAPDKTILEYVNSENPNMVEMAKKGAKLKQLKKYKKGKSISKCSCGCNMITSREKGGKMVSKCACGCKN